LTNARAIAESSARPGSTKGFVKVLLEFCIGEFSCLITAPDQVFTRLGLGVESVDERSQSPPDPISNDRIADLSTDRVGDGDRRVIGGASNEADSK
jgi:hypothetical protein